jgi:uncharacterized OB-fold protein/acyl dehydratase
MSESEAAAFVAGLRAGVGMKGKSRRARDPVNQPMIRHWCDAMEDHNPLYTDPAFAAASSFGGIQAPPSMLDAWLMPGNVPRGSSPDEPSSRTYAALDAAGFSSVVATNTEHEYLRYLVPGDWLSASSRVESVSDEKKTGLGVGHFVTTLTEFTDQAGEPVGRVRFRILKFKPGTGRGAGAGDVAAARPPRPRPGISCDTSFFWEGLEQGELRIQRCEGCRALHHPPLVRCPDCGGYEFGHAVSSGRGLVYSFVEPCHPRIPMFDYPYVVGLVELEEGTRLITNIVDIDPEAVTVGMPVELVMRQPDPDLTLPMFRPVRPPRREKTLRVGELQLGASLAPCPIDITAKLIIAGAIASRDYQDVHHDREMAVKRGSPEIFMNILTTAGLCGRYVGDWAGPEARLRKLSIRLGAPNYPHDSMTLSGSVRALDAATGRVEVAIRGANRLGDHVTGVLELELPGGKERS